MTANTSPLRLLIVEDVEADAALLVDTLERSGQAVSPRRVETAEALRAALQEQGWDLMTCAHHLPRFDAPAAVTLAHALCPDLPIIVVSKDMSQSLAVQVMRSGARDYVRKDELAALPLAVARELRAVEVERERRQAEAALRESEARWHFALEGAEEGVWDFNMQTGEAFRSRQWKARLGYAEDDIINTLAGWETLIHPDDHDRVMAADEPFRAGQLRAFNIEYRIRCKDGSYRWTLDRGKIMSYTPDGRPLRAIGTATDITERKQAEAELTRLKDFNAGIIESMAEGVVVQDAEGRLTFANPAAGRILGRTPDELLGRAWGAIVSVSHPPEVPAAAERHRAGIQDWYEADVLRPDGRRVPLLVSGSPRYENGQFAGTLAVFADLSEQQKAQAALHESEARWQYALEGAEEGVWDLNLQTGEAFRSRQWKALLGYAEDEVPNTRAAWQTLVHPDDYERVMAADQLFINSQTPDFQVEYRIRCKDGRYRWTLDRGKVISHTPDGRPLRAIGIQADITQRKQAEAELTRLKDLNEGIVQTMAEGITLQDPEGRVTFANPAAYRILGRTPEELLGQTWYTLVAPEWESDIHAAAARRRAGLQDRYEVDVVRPDGRRVPVLASGSPRYENGHLAGTMVVFTDLTERRQAQAALHESEARWQYALEGADAGVWDWDIRTGQVFLSRQWKAMLGYAEDEIAGNVSAWEALIHPDDHDRVTHALEQLLADRTPVYHVEYRLRCQDGSYKWVVDRGKVISRGAEGRPLRAIGTQTDITERKQAEAELMRLKELNEGIVQSMAEGITVEDPEGHVTFANPAAYRMLGRTPENLLGQTWHTFVPPDWHPEINAIDERRRAGIQDRYESELLRPDGHRVPVLVSGSPRYENGEYVGTLGVFTDLSESRQAAEQLRDLETRFNSLVKNAPWGMHLCQQAADGRMVLVAANQACDAILGLSHAELIGKPLDEALAGFKGPDLASHYREVVERGTFWEAEHMDYVNGQVASAYSVQAFRMGTGRALGVFSNKLENKRAQEIIHAQAEELHSQVQELRQQNRELIAQGEAFHRVEQELRASEQKYRALIDLTDTGYVILDTAGRVREANDEYLRLTGRAEMADILGHSIVEWTAPYDRARNLREFQACLEEGFVRDLQIDYADDAGQITRIEIDAATVSTDEDVAIVTLCRDISERRWRGGHSEFDAEYGEDGEDYAAF